MPTATETIVLGLSDSAGRDLGTVAVESIRDGLIVGDFTPGPDYPAVEPAFRAFSEMVEDFSLSLIDHAAEAIARIGVTVRADASHPPVAVWDVQIYPDGGFSCRLPPKPAERNGHPVG